MTLFLYEQDCLEIHVRELEDTFSNLNLACTGVGMNRPVVMVMLWIGTCLELDSKCQVKPWQRLSTGPQLISVPSTSEE